MRAKSTVLTLALVLTLPSAAWSQSVQPSDIKEHMEVIGADTKHVGTVDKVQGDTIELTKNDPVAGGKHHAIPVAWVDTAGGGKVVLHRTGDEAMSAWQEVGRPAGDAKKP